MDLEEIVPYVCSGPSMKVGYGIASSDMYAAGNVPITQSGIHKSPINIDHHQIVCEFESTQNLTAMEIDWLPGLMPGAFQVLFSEGSSEEWIPATNLINKIAHQHNGVGNYVQQSTDTDALFFRRMLLMKKIKLNMLHPLSPLKQIGIRKIHFFTSSTSGALVNRFVVPNNSMAFFVNSDNPTEGEEVSVYELSKILYLCDGRELFVWRRDFALVHVNSGMCVGTDQNMKIVLRRCSTNDPQFALRKDAKTGCWHFTGISNHCITAQNTTNSKPQNFIDQDTSIIASSKLDDMHTEKQINTGAPEPYISKPGDETVNITINFGYFSGKVENKKIDTIVIEFGVPPESVTTFVRHSQGSWELFNKTVKPDGLTSIKGNWVYGASVLLVFNNLSESPDLNNQKVVSIRRIYISDDSMQLRLTPCSDSDINKKQFDFEPLPRLSQNYCRENDLQKRLANDAHNLALQNFKKLTALNKPFEQLRNMVDLMENKMEEEKQNMSNQFDAQMTNYFTKELDVITNPLFFEICDQYGAADQLTNNNLENTPSYGDPERPASSCYEIKRQLKYPESGFYWIQNECAKTPVKMLCDFSSDPSKVFDYLILPTTIGDQTINTELIEGPEQVRGMCANYGLEPVEIIAPVQLSRIKNLAVAQGIPISQNNVIPIGFNFTCRLRGCQKFTYNSINSHNSSDLRKFANITEGFTTNENTDFVGINDPFSSDLVILGNKHMSALVCSSNHSSANFEDKRTKNIGENDTLDKLSYMFKPGNQYLVRCSSYIRTGKSQTDDIQTDGGKFNSDKKICAAARSQGLISESGGKFELKVSISSLLNEVFTRTSKKQFTVTKYYPVCPGNIGTNTNFIQVPFQFSFIEASAVSAFSKDAPRIHKLMSEMTPEELKDYLDWTAFNGKPGYTPPLLDTPVPNSSAAPVAAPAASPAVSPAAPVTEPTNPLNPLAAPANPTNTSLPGNLGTNNLLTGTNNPTNNIAGRPPYADLGNPQGWTPTTPQQREGIANGYGAQGELNQFEANRTGSPYMKDGVGYDSNGKLTFN